MEPKGLGATRSNQRVFLGPSRELLQISNVMAVHVTGGGMTEPSDARDGKQM